MQNRRRQKQKGKRLQQRAWKSKRQKSAHQREPQMKTQTKKRSAMKPWKSMQRRRAGKRRKTQMSRWKMQSTQRRQTLPADWKWVMCITSTQKSKDSALWKEIYRKLWTKRSISKRKRLLRIKLQTLTVPRTLRRKV